MSISFVLIVMKEGVIFIQLCKNKDEREIENESCFLVGDEVLGNVIFRQEKFYLLYNLKKIID